MTSIGYKAAISACARDKSGSSRGALSAGWHKPCGKTSIGYNAAISACARDKSGSSRWALSAGWHKPCRKTSIGYNAAISACARDKSGSSRGPSQQIGTSPAGKPPLVVMPLSVLARGTRVATSSGLAPDLYEYRRREWQLALGWLNGMARQLSCSGHHQL
jgi:hypothetical protein